MEPLVVLGLVGGLISVAGAVPYLRDVVRGTTVPHRGAWLVWTVLGGVALAAQVSAGAGWGAAFLWVQVLGMILILALALPWGTGGTRPVELAALGFAVLGVIGWQVTDSPFVATVCVCIADAVGFALMLPKAYRDPWSETTSTYLLAALSGVCPLLAAGQSPELLLYPAWFTVANGLVAIVLLRRRSLAGSVTPRHALPARDRRCTTCATSGGFVHAPWAPALLAA